MDCKNPEMKYKLAIFDLDGTVLDTLDDLYNSVNAALLAQGFCTRTRDEVRAFVGNGMIKLVERALPQDATAAQRERAYRDLIEHYALHCADHTAPYPGIPAFLERLREAGVLLAVVSNKDDAAVKALCAQYFKGCFQIALGRRCEEHKKPDPHMVNEVLLQLGVSKEDAVYVGDTGVDLETARNAGLTCISVSWGFRDLAHLYANGATCIVDTAEQLFEEMKK